MAHTKMIRNIKDQEWTLIAVPWKDASKAPVFVKVRELSDLQIQAIGNFSLLNGGKKAPTTDWRAITNTMALQAAVVKAALVSPTYEELCAMASLGDFSKTVEEKYREIADDIETMEAGPERSECEKRLASLRVLFDMVLPNAFAAKVCEYVLGVNRTNIKLVSDEIILNAAFARHDAGTGRISDFISDDTLTPFNRRDIDQRGRRLFAEYLEKNKGKK